MSGRRGRRGRRGWSRWLIPLGLFGLAALVRLALARQLPFSATEGSAYYVGVAQNLVEGHGLVSDAIWSYATPPLELPKPAFELWMPLTSLLAALGMAVLGPGLWAAQVVSALVGALVAPLTWAVASEATRAQGLDGRRTGAVRLGSGLLAAVLAPFVIAAAVPDSYTPFLVGGVAAALLVPRALGSRVEAGGRSIGPSSVVHGCLLGICLGLTWLARQEAVWLGLTVLLMCIWVVRSGIGPGSRLREGLRRLAPIAAGGLLVVVPWLLRNAAVFGSPFGGQALENAVLRHNEDIFAFSERPGLSSYLGQGLDVVLANPVAAMAHQLLDVLILPAFPVGVAGLVGLVALRRAPAIRSVSALGFLLLGGGMSFLATALVFPVATLWGTFLHGSGPLLAALAVVAVLGADALLTRISTIRGWQPTNVIVGPAALLTVTVGMLVLQVAVVIEQSSSVDARYRSIASWLADAGDDGRGVPATLISDHPIWLAEATGGYAVVLPDEDLESILSLARKFDASWLVVIGERGRYPDALLETSARPCLAEPPASLETSEGTVWRFELVDACAP